MAAAGVALAVTMMLAGSEWGFATGGEVYVQFGNGIVSGASGCNLFSGSFEQTGPQLKIGPLAVTKLACFDEKVMQTEQQFLMMLQSVRTADVTHVKLILKDSDGKQLAVLVRRDWD